MPRCEKPIAAARIKTKSVRRRLFILFVVVMATASWVFFTGPRVMVSWHADDPAVNPASPANSKLESSIPEASRLDAWLTRSEAAIADLIPGTEKTIRWASAPGARTDIALVYLHGFSSSRQESRPLMEEVAAALNANLYFARLSGHGRGGDALAAATVADWQRDAWEALAIGRQLGGRVVLVGASNGGALATWLASQSAAADLAALVLLSPNYGPRDPMSEILLWPWAHVLVRWVVGPDYEWKPRNPEHARYWTWRYPSKALLVMMGVVKLARMSPVERIKAPVLVLYAREDRVVNANGIERFFPRFGAVDKVLIPVENTSDPQHHALSGDILAPEDTARVRAMMLDFLCPRLKTCRGS
ncbi:alpha/beta hydrolase [Thiorhodovibrio winogradskyi]|nr:YqiA/YcfP family alpha/beta fold hydrolase [Thiorhodovibrio winogradskyi]